MSMELNWQEPLSISPTDNLMTTTMAERERFFTVSREHSYWETFICSQRPSSKICFTGARESRKSISMNLLSLLRSEKPLLPIITRQFSPQMEPTPQLGRTSSILKNLTTLRTTANSVTFISKFLLSQTAPQLLMSTLSISSQGRMSSSSSCQSLIRGSQQASTSHGQV